MNPIIVSSSFERFSRHRRPTLFPLLLLVVLQQFDTKLFLEALLFSLPISLLLVGDFGRFDKLMLPAFDGT